MELQPKLPRRSFGFPTTRWTLILSLRSKDPAAVRQALQELVVAYRSPLLAYLRCTEVDFDDVPDALQDFLVSAIEKQTLQRANPELGRFRAFLKTCLRNFVHERHRRLTAQKLGGDVPHVPFEDAIDPSRTTIPSEAFDRAWAVTVLDRAVEGVAADYARRNRSAVFEALKQTLASEREETLVQIGAALGLNPESIRVEAHRLRQRLATRLRAQIADTVLDPEDIEAELRFLRSALATRGPAA